MRLLAGLPADRRAGREQLGRLGCGEADVEVDAGLHGARLRHPVDPDDLVRRPAQPGIEAGVPVREVDQSGTQREPPERGDDRDVVGVQAEVLVPGDRHRPIMP
jgi:hypothetical protein